MWIVYNMKVVFDIKFSLNLIIYFIKSKRLESSRAERLILRERQQFIENAQKKFQFNFKKLQALKNERTELFADAAAKAQHIAEIAKKRSKITAEYVTSAQNLLSLNKVNSN